MLFNLSSFWKHLKELKFDKSLGLQKLNSSF